MNSKAILRMVEAVLASIILLLAFTISYHYATPPNPFTVRAKGDLEKIAYDLLHRLAEERSLDKTLEGNNQDLLEGELKAALRTLLPKNIIYSLIVYKAKWDGSRITLEELCTVSNTELDEFIRASETGGATVTYTYSTIDGGCFYTLILHLTLARPER